MEESPTGPSWREAEPLEGNRLVPEPKKSCWMENQLLGSIGGGGVGSTRGQRSAGEMLLPTSRGLSGEKDLRKSFLLTK